MFMKIVTNILKYFRGYIIKAPICRFELCYIPKKNNEVIYSIKQSIENFYNANPGEENYGIEYDKKVFQLEAIGGERIFDYDMLRLGNVNTHYFKSIYGELNYYAMKYLSKNYLELFEKGILNYYNEVIKIRYGQNIKYYKYGKLQKVIEDVPPEYYIDLCYSNNNLQIKSYENIKHLQNWLQENDWYKKI